MLNIRQYLIGGTVFDILVLVVLFLLLVSSCAEPQLSYADDPLTQPLDSVGVTGYNTELCNDKWDSCTEYDRQQFDSKYPGTDLDTISLYPLAEGTENYNPLASEGQEDSGLEGSTTGISGGEGWSSSETLGTSDER